jgi:Na+-driven multidrug efflux pump
MKKLTQYVVPTILGNCAYFLFTIIDGIFVGQGVGTDALGAVNLVWPFVMVLNAIIMLTVVGGVTVSAVRIGRGDIAGANQAFMHSLAGTLTASIVMTLIGTCLTSQIATLLGANETYHRLVCDYLFWYSLFAVPSGLMTFMNNYCRNDGSPVLVSVGSTIATVINIFLDWLFVFPLQKGLMGAAIATGISQTCGMLIVSSHFILRRRPLRSLPSRWRRCARTTSCLPASATWP